MEKISDLPGPLPVGASHDSLPVVANQGFKILFFSLQIHYNPGCFFISGLILNFIYLLFLLYLLFYLSINYLFKLFIYNIKENNVIT